MEGVPDDALDDALDPLLAASIASLGTGGLFIRWRKKLMESTWSLVAHVDIASQWEGGEDEWVSGAPPEAGS
eukprot:2310644-Pyramimonas_sp.AAC.1